MEDDGCVPWRQFSVSSFSAIQFSVDVQTALAAVEEIHCLVFIAPSLLVAAIEAARETQSRRQSLANPFNLALELPSCPSITTTPPPCLPNNKQATTSPA